jgi:hypothetical protein
MVWTLIEPGVAITASSLVTIRPLLRAWRVPGFVSTENSGPSTGGMSKGKAGSRSRMTGGSKTANSASRETSTADGDVELGTSTFRGNQKGASQDNEPVLKTHRSKASNMSRISEGEFSLVDGTAPKDGIQVTRRIEIHSMHHSEEDKVTDDRGMTWLAADSSSTNSSIELSGMSPVHSQSVGLGVPRDRERDR